MEWRRGGVGLRFEEPTEEDGDGIEGGQIMTMMMIGLSGKRQLWALV